MGPSALGTPPIASPAAPPIPPPPPPPPKPDPKGQWISIPGKAVTQGVKAESNTAIDKVGDPKKGSKAVKADAPKGASAPKGP
jgi:hypothetical protein